MLNVITYCEKNNGNVFAITYGSHLQRSQQVLQLIFMVIQQFFFNFGTFLHTPNGKRAIDPSHLANSSKLS
jgi:hypothetical protein